MLDIASGFYHKLTNGNQDLKEERIKICNSCPIKSYSVFGDVCNKKLFLNPKTNEVSKINKDGFYHGCGCVIDAAVRVKFKQCPAGKW